MADLLAALFNSVAHREEIEITPKVVVRLSIYKNNYRVE
ncbi:MAG: hypothetical protein ACJA09_004030 [Alcanivorax sp.]|jgi:hypothetical protein